MGFIISLIFVFSWIWDRHLFSMFTKLCPFKKKTPWILRWSLCCSFKVLYLIAHLSNSHWRTFYRTCVSGGCIYCLDLSCCFYKKTRAWGLLWLAVFLLWTRHAVRLDSSRDVCTWLGLENGSISVHMGWPESGRVMTRHAEGLPVSPYHMDQQKVLSGKEPVIGWVPEKSGWGWGGVPGSLEGSCRVMWFGNWN